LRFFDFLVVLAYLKGRPAEKAGFKKCDIVTKSGVEEVTDMMSYMNSLSKHESGDKLDIKIKRKN